MTYYKGDHIVIRKEDTSPVTEADRAADRLIVAGLRSLEADIPIVSEEGEKPVVSTAPYFWLVDPLDGTRSFIRGQGYFTVNIALVHQPAVDNAADGISPSPFRQRVTSYGPNPLLIPLPEGRGDRDKGGGIPILGIIYDPVNEIMYWGSQDGAFYQERDGAVLPLHCRKAPGEGLSALISHSHTNEATETWLRDHSVTQRIPCASSIKFCFLAQGKADLYPRFGPTSEWDTAAGHAILIAAGGKMLTPDGKPFLYGKPGFVNGNFVASGK